MKTAADPFKELRASGWKPTTEMVNPDNYPIKIEVPAGPITLERTRRNCRMLVEYFGGPRLRLVKRLLQEEAEDILARLNGTVKDDKGRAAYAQAETRYRKAVKIAMRWIKNYTELNFRSLGSYTRADLDKIAAAPDAF